MRINWLSPVPPAPTAIGDFSRRIMPSLAERMQVTLWTDVEGAAAEACPGVPIRSCRQLELCWTDLNFADFTLYNIGNDARFHAHYLGMLERHPGVVILHDFNLHEINRERFLQGPGGEKAFARYVYQLAGAEGLRRVIRFRQGKETFEDVVEALPLIQSVTRHATGIIAFNEAMLDSLRERTKAPLLFCPLPMEREGRLPPPAKRSFTEGEPVELVMFGYLNSPNRRLPEVIEAVAGYAKGPVHLTLFGHIENRAGFARQLQGTGARDRIDYLGYLDEERMREVLQRAHLAINLRNPTRGESSDSLLRAWKHALPMLVTNTGYYATLPKGVACPVEPGDEVGGIHRHLDAFRSSPESYFAIGEAGYRHLLTNHTTETFAANLEEFLGMAEAYRKRSFVFNLSRRLASRLHADIADAGTRRRLAERLSAEAACWIGPGGTA